MGPSWWESCLYKRGHQIALTPLCHVRTWREGGHLQNRKRSMLAFDLELPASRAVRGRPSRFSPFPSPSGPHECPSVGLLASRGGICRRPQRAFPPWSSHLLVLDSPPGPWPCGTPPPAPYSTFLCQQAVHEDFCRFCSCYPFFSLPSSFSECIFSKLPGPRALHLTFTCMAITRA